MPTQRKTPNRLRTEAVRVMVTPMEFQELQLAAEHAGMALSVFIRVKALESARNLEIRAA